MTRRHCNERQRDEHDLQLSPVISLWRQNGEMPLWTINATVSNTQRTNNETEAWNNTFAQQIGYSHPSLYRLLDKLSKDTDLVHCKKQYDPWRLLFRQQQSVTITSIVNRLHVFGQHHVIWADHTRVPAVLWEQIKHRDNRWLAVVLSKSLLRHCSVRDAETDWRVGTDGESW